MNKYIMKSPIYYAVSIQGCHDNNGWHLSNEDEIDEFAKKFNMDWRWNMRTGVLSFYDKSKGVKLDRPEYVQIGNVVMAYDDCGTWRVYTWSYEDFEKKFIMSNDEMIMSNDEMTTENKLLRALVKELADELSKFHAWEEARALVAKAREMILECK